MLAEQLRIVHETWTEETLNAEGRHYVVRDNPGLPKPAQAPHPPLIVGTRGGDRAIDLAGRWADELNVFGVDPEDFEPIAPKLAAACERHGRPANDVRLSWMGRVPGRGDELIARMRAYADAGVARAYLQHLEHRDLDAVAEFGREVVPALSMTPGEDLGALEAIHSLRAIRVFAPDPIPDATIEALIDAAVRAPSPQNCQPWAFVVVRDPETRSKIAEIYRRVWNVIREPVYGDLDAIEDPAQKRLLKATDRLAQAVDEAPVFVFAMLDRRRLGNMVTPDLETLLEPSAAYGAVWAAVQNLVVAARAMGIGSITTTLTRLQEQETRVILGHPEGVETATMLALGYPRPPEKFGPTTRRTGDEVTHRDRWEERSTS